MSVLVVGAGGHAKVVVATLQAAGRAVVGCLDDRPGAEGTVVLGVPVIGPTSRLAEHAGEAVLAIGANAVRQRLAAAHPGVAWATAVHPSAVVHESVRLGPGTVVFAGAVLQPDVTVGAHAIVNTGATVDHDGRIEDYVHVAPGCHLSGGVTLKEGAFLGVGAACLPGVAVGAWTTVGGGRRRARSSAERDRRRCPGTSSFEPVSPCLEKFLAVPRHPLSLRERDPVAPMALGSRPLTPALSTHGAERETGWGPRAVGHTVSDREDNPIPHVILSERSESKDLWRAPI